MKKSERIRIFKRQYMFSWYSYLLTEEETKAILNNSHVTYNLFPKWRPYNGKKVELVDFEVAGTYELESFYSENYTSQLMYEDYYIGKKQFEIIKNTRWLILRIYINEIIKNKKKGIKNEKLI